MFASIPHVLWGFDRWDELECDVDNTNQGNDASENIVHNVGVEED